MKLNDLESLPDSLRKNVEVRTIAPGQRLFRQGDRATELYVIRSGYFKEIRQIKEQKIATLQMLTVGESLGEISLIADNYFSTAISQVNSEVIVYPVDILLKALVQNTDLLSPILELFGQKINCLQQRLEWRDTKPAQERILHYLMHQAFINNSKEINLKFSLQEIAAELGFTPETLSRGFQKLETTGAITRQQNIVVLRDFNAA